MDRTSFLIAEGAIIKEMKLLKQKIAKARECCNFRAEREHQIELDALQIQHDCMVEVA